MDRAKVCPLPSNSLQVVSSQPSSLLEVNEKRSKLPMSRVQQRSFELFNMQIANAHLFAPHANIGVLSDHDMLLVHEEYGPLRKRFSNFKKYTVLSKTGETLFIATEDTPSCWPSNTRSMNLVVREGTGDEEIMTISKPCDCGCCFNCFDEVKVFSPPGNLIGTVSEACGIIRPKYQIFDATLPDSPLFEINGPICKFSCFCGDIDFPIKECVDKKHGITERHAGIISKKWGGFLKELFTDADSFGVSFPPDLDPKYKVLFLAACFLIDKKHFDRSA